MAANATEESLSPRVRSAVVDLLYRLADDNLVLGHRNSEWTGLAPILEADIALSSMAQDKMGHALTFYRLLHDLGEPDPDSLAFLRKPEQFRCCSLVALERGDWALSIVRHFMFDEATQLRLEALVDSAYAPLAAVARKLRGELKYHVMHGRMNVARLGRGTEESRSRIQAAVDRLFPHGLGIFEPTDRDETIAAEGVQCREAELCAAWRGRVEPILVEAGLTLPESTEPIYGGRRGRHPETLARLLDDMQQVYRLDPEAKW
ncbi:MAG: 1,2-phenylacetyl-CoA epoxidase subunit PaaC [Phycisphaerae bacterium]